MYEIVNFLTKERVFPKNLLFTDGRDSSGSEDERGSKSDWTLLPKGASIEISSIAALKNKKSP